MSLGRARPSVKRAPLKQEHPETGCSLCAERGWESTIFRAPAHGVFLLKKERYCFFIEYMLK